ncbi:MAG: ABC transporter substrate-binding protein [Desulfobacter sp.]|nr:MAG: ABC transporter substrate-binding protein [Desulfobacter sp.]
MQSFVDIRIGHLNILDHLILAPAGACGEPPGNRPAAPRLTGSVPEIYLQPLNSWEQVARGLQSGDINAAFISIPLAMALSQQKQDIALVMFTHRGGSRMAAATGVKQIKDFRGKSVLIPHALSIQNMLLHRFLDARNLIPEKAGDRRGVCAESIPSFLMPEMAARDHGEIAALICEAPFGTEAIDRGGARHLLATQDLWPDHPGSAFVVHRDLLKGREADISALVSFFFRCAEFIDARIQAQDDALVPLAADFLQKPAGLVRRALAAACIRYTPELLVPEPELLSVIARYMGENMGLLPGPIDMENFVVPGFARQALEEFNC